MNQRLTLILLGWLLAFAAHAQQGISTPPAAPNRLTFADMTLTLDDDARRTVQRDIDALLANRQYWTAKLDRIALYFPIIESILASENVPTDFKYLAVQESSLTPDAVSTSNAVGYWQFKAETATGLGMRVDDQVDERKSITASTHGAAQYLKRSNARFNNWLASLYSYYLGATGISTLIPPNWTNAREVALDGQTDRYILRFLAHKIAIDNALASHQAGNRISLLEYANGGGKTFQAIADELKVDEFELRQYNRWTKGDAIPTDKTYVLAVPVLNTQINDVRQKFASVSTPKAPELGKNDIGFPVLRRVTASGGKNAPVLFEINGLPGIQAQTGNTPASLARQARISLSSFLRYNDMAETDALIPGDVYYIAKKKKKGPIPFHTARMGETVRSISQRYGMRLKKLLRFNRMTPADELVAGRVMWLRVRRPSNTAVEIINAPTKPVYDNTPTPAPATTSPTVARNETRSVAGSDNIPRDASERKLYKPKLAEGGVTTNDGSSTPATAAPSPAQATVLGQTASDGWSTGSTGSGLNKNRRTNTGAATGSTEGSQRVVIVRTPDNATGTETTTKTLPVATRPQRTQAPIEEPAPNRTTTDSKAYADARQRQKDRDEAEAKLKQEAEAKAEARARERVLREKAEAKERLTASKPTPQPKQEDEEAREKAEAKERLAAMLKKQSEEQAKAREEARKATASSNISTHTVEAGQTYYSISRQYGLTVDELLAINHLTSDKALSIGQKLRVKPTGKISSSSEKTDKSKDETKADKPKESSAFHVVEKGQTLYSISKMYDVSVEQLQEWNNLSDNNVQVGKKLRIRK